MLIVHIVTNQIKLSYGSSSMKILIWIFS